MNKVNKCVAMHNAQRYLGLYARGALAINRKRPVAHHVFDQKPALFRLIAVCDIVPNKKCFLPLTMCL